MLPLSNLSIIRYCEIIHICPIPGHGESYLFDEDKVVAICGWLHTPIEYFVFVKRDQMAIIQTKKPTNCESKAGDVLPIFRGKVYNANQLNFLLYLQLL